MAYAFKNEPYFNKLQHVSYSEMWRNKIFQVKMQNVIYLYFYIFTCNLKTILNDNPFARKKTKQYRVN